MDMNRLTLIGRVGRDPEIKTFDNGGRIAKFSVATSERWKDKAGAQQERTEWHNVVVKNECLVKFVETSLKRGGHIYIEGKLESRKYVGTGAEERTAIEVVLSPFRGEIILLGGSKAQEGEARVAELVSQTAAALRPVLDDNIPN